MSSTVRRPHIQVSYTVTGTILLTVILGILGFCTWGVTQNVTEPPPLDFARDGASIDRGGDPSAMLRINAEFAETPPAVSIPLEAIQVQTETSPALPEASPVVDADHVVTPPLQDRVVTRTVTIQETPPLVVVSQQPKPPVRYIVRKGDTLSGIAKAHGVSTKALLQANGLQSRNHIRAGQRMRIPQPSHAKVDIKPKNKASDMIESALAYQGVRYRYGGMSNRGFDCSGFVARVLQGQGMDMPHNSAALFQCGQPVEKSKLRQGDLVFFHTRGRAGRISHVGIYMGAGKFIHASSGKGRVRVDSLMDGYYAQRYAGARRIL